LFLTQVRRGHKVPFLARIVPVNILLAIVVAGLLELFFGPDTTDQKLLATYNRMSPLTLITFGVLVMPILETIFFQWFLSGLFERILGNRLAAIVVATVIFGAVHFTNSLYSGLTVSLISAPMLGFTFYAWAGEHGRQIATEVTILHHIFYNGMLMTPVIFGKAFFDLKL